MKNATTDQQIGLVAGNTLAQDLGSVTPAAYDEVLTVTAMTDFDGTPGGAFGAW